MAKSPKSRKDSLIALAEARRIISEGIAATGPQLPGMNTGQRKLEEMLDVFEQVARGELSVPEGMDVFIEKGFMTRPPAWLRSEIAYELRRDIAQAEKGRQAAVKELIDWLRKEVAKDAGRTTDPELQKAYQQAARLRATTKLSWGAITRKVCPGLAKLGHRCSQACEDRVRLGATRYRKSTRENPAA